MPPVVFALAAAVGLIAAARIVVAMLGEPPSEQMQAGGEPQKQASASETARDLGKLEFDASAGVYRPKS